MSGRLIPAAVNTSMISSSAVIAFDTSCRMAWSWCRQRSNDELTPLVPPFDVDWPRAGADQIAVDAVGGRGLVEPVLAAALVVVSARPMVLVLVVSVVARAVHITATTPGFAVDIHLARPVVGAWALDPKREVIAILDLDEVKHVGSWS